MLKIVGNLGLVSGAIAGGLLTAPLIGLMYLLDNLFGLPFPPFALFDWIARVLPGPLVTFGIDLMIDGIRLGGLSVADTAKTAEQIMAVLLFLSIGIAATALFFAVMRSRNIAPEPISGLVVGGLFGLPMTVVSIPMGQSTLDPVSVLLGLLVPFLVWGFACVSVYRRLTAESDGLITEDEVRWSKSIGRREFLVRLGAASATIVVLSSGAGGLLAQRERRELNQAIAAMDESNLSARGAFPNADDPLMPAPGTRPEFTSVEDHYKVFLRTEPTIINIDTWTLPITGLVDNPLVLTLDDIQTNYESRDQYITLSCISGRIPTTLISTTWWTGVSLQKILADVQVRPEARYLIITSGDGFYETVDLDLIASDERIMLAYAWDGHPIPFDHGFPLRIWLPDRYGMKQPKWITGIEVTDEYRPGYWVERSWDEVAQVQAVSVIDTVAVKAVIEADGQKLVPIGGMAFAGDRGISKVEVRVDGGEWREAQLRAPLSETTWVIWRYDWPFAEGKHTFEVRCAEADGTPQIETERGTRPSGATGIHRRKTNI
ncbi:MAG: molybdopterin-dependent oxidoreductase [Chloroflexi bacterium]|nr:molybdopterin-dependent oxidoreductase [Chloroflexota bacterium]